MGSTTHTLFPKHQVRTLFDTRPSVCASSNLEVKLVRTITSSMCPLHRRPAVPPQQRGFTLIELLVVVVIIGLLAGLVAPKFMGQVGKSNTSIARAQIEQLGKALDTYRLDVGTYPTTEQGLQALVVKPDGVERWQGPYLVKGVPPDPWGRPYRYKTPGDHGDYDMTSYGLDGQPGGTGENADVNSWDVAPPRSQ
jgi:general secretion pathway protein G